MRDKIKVAICINDFLVGGAQRMLADMVHRVDKERFEIVLITLFFWEGKEYFYELIPEGVPVHRLSFRGFWDIRSWILLHRLLRSLDADVVLSNLFFSNTVVRILKPFFRYKVLVVEHNTYVNKTKLHQRVDRFLSGWTERIVAVSNTVADFTSKQEGIPREKFIVIPNGIDIARLRDEYASADRAEVRKELGIPDDARVILNVARLTTQKNPRLLLEGFALFARTHPRDVLVIVGGDAKWEKILKEQARSLKVAERVFLMGMRKDVARFYAIADAFVSTSDIEGFGIAHAEALACGVPVLSTKTAGPDVMIEEGKNGFFIAESTPETVSAGLEKITSADREAMSRAARESAEKYDIKRTAIAYGALIDEVLR